MSMQMTFGLFFYNFCVFFSFMGSVLIICLIQSVHGMQTFNISGQSAQLDVGELYLQAWDPVMWSCAFAQHCNSLRLGSALKRKLKVGGERHSLPSYYTLALFDVPTASQCSLQFHVYCIVSVNRSVVCLFCLKSKGAKAGDAVMEKQSTKKDKKVCLLFT